MKLKTNVRMLLKDGQIVDLILNKGKRSITNKINNICKKSKFMLIENCNCNQIINIDEIKYIEISKKVG